VYRDAAWSIFDKDCLVRMGTNIAAAGTGKVGEHCMTVELDKSSGEHVKEELNFGEIKIVELGEREEAKAMITPAKEFDVGAGPGKELETTVSGGVAGLMLDARGRPLHLPENESQRKELLLSWFKSVQLYDPKQLEALI
jgi:hypothetical protein